MIRLAFLCGVMCALSIQASATSIIVIRTPDKIVIAADSKRTHRNRPPELVCKIRKVGGIYFSLTGIESPAAVEPGLRIDAYSNASRAASEKQKITDIADLFADLEKQQLNRILPIMKLRAPELYRSLNGHLLDGLFVGMQDGSPTWIDVHFWELPSAVHSQRNVCPGQCAPGGIIVLGVRRAIVEAEHHSGQFPTGDPETLAASLVKIEIDGEPEDVGPPISELRIDRTGAHWLSRGVCQDGPDRPSR